MLDEATVIEFTELVRQHHLAVRQQNAAKEFVLSTPNYYMDPVNERLMYEALYELGLDGTDPRHYNVAYQTLQRQGRLVGPEGARPTSRSLSERQSSRQPVAQPMSEEQLRAKLDSMSLEDGRRYMIERMGQR